MVENLVELSPEQKNDLQEFVDRAYANYSLWWIKENMDVLTVTCPLEDYFEDKTTIDALNALLLDFHPVDDEKKVLQLIRDFRHSRCTLNPPLYYFRFKDRDKVENIEFELENLSGVDTQLLLEILDSIFEDLKGPLKYDYIDE